MYTRSLMTRMKRNVVSHVALFTVLAVSTVCAPAAGNSPVQLDNSAFAHIAFLSDSGMTEGVSPGGNPRPLSQRYLEIAPGLKDLIEVISTQATIALPNDELIDRINTHLDLSHPGTELVQLQGNDQKPWFVLVFQAAEAEDRVWLGTDLDYWLQHTSEVWVGESGDRPMDLATGSGASDEDTSGTTCTNTNLCTWNTCTSSTSPNCTKSCFCTNATSCTSGIACTNGVGCTQAGGCTGGPNCTNSGACTGGGWCTNGGQCTNGTECTLGLTCTAGTACTGGTRCTLGTNCTAGFGCTNGPTCTTGNTCSNGAGCPGPLTSGRACTSPANCPDPTPGALVPETGLSITARMVTSLTSDSAEGGIVWLGLLTCIVVPGLVFRKADAS